MAPIDWSGLTPENFEFLCRDLLRCLNFSSVEHYGGAGDKGRDLVCTKDLSLSPGFALLCRFVVQCKHTPQGINKSQILEDISKVVGQRFDFWWLMTSARLTPADRDWLRDIPKSRYGMGIFYIDRDVIEHWLRQFSHVLVQYFPSAATSAEAMQAKAMLLMAEKRYSLALKLLHENDDGSHPRFSYLLACCCSMISKEKRLGKKAALARALRHLRESARRGYIEFLEKQFGWPRSKALFEINRDPELRELRRYRGSEFLRVYSLPPANQGGGGCFPSASRISLADLGNARIDNISIGDQVVSYPLQGSRVYSKVIDVKESRSEEIININGEIETTPEQPFMTTAGWRTASLLCIGDILICFDGLLVVHDVGPRDNDQVVFQLRLTGLPYYFVNGFLVHNKEEPE